MLLYKYLFENSIELNAKKIEVERTIPILIPTEWQAEAYDEF